MKADATVSVPVIKRTVHLGVEMTEAEAETLYDELSRMRTVVSYEIFKALGQALGKIS